MPEETKVRPDVLAMFHPNTIQGKGPSTAAARIAMAGIYDTLGKLQDLARTNADRGMIAARATPLATSVASRADSAIRSVTENIAALDKSI